MTHTPELHALRELSKTPTQAVHAIGAGDQKLLGSYRIPLSEYLVREGWASKVWNERGVLQGLQITDEGMVWLEELERQLRAYLARP